MSATMDRQNHWHKIPMVWLLIALPLTAVIASLLTVWIAARNADTLVSNDYYKVGMAPLQRTEQDARAAALGLGADIQVTAETVSVRLKGTLAPLPASLTLMLAHPTEAAEDILLTLTQVSDGSYAGPMPPMPPGKRRLVLQTVGGDWRLTGEALVPLSASLQLASVQPHSSTNP